MITWNRGVGLLAALAPLLLGGCGAGTAGIVAGSNGSSGGSTPALDAFVVEGPKESPSLLKLDASQPVRVALFYDLGAGEQAMTQLAGVAGNEVDLPAGELPLTWDFASEPGIGTASFTSGVRLLAKRGNAVLSGGELTLGLGNDAPVIAVEDPAPEVDGVVPIQLRLSDSSGDAVAIRVEFKIEGELDWQPARPGGLDAKDPTPDPALTGIVAPPNPGAEIVFFWDTDSDLAELEREVRVRFTPIDPVVPGTTKETAIFRVDNNAPPIVQLFNDAVVTNPDERRGIPVPFQVFDDEGDQVEVIFQWRREREEFPPLLESEIDAVLADPVLRRERHICTEYPRFAHGLVVPIDATTVRLPELARGESWILASGIVGRSLELLRPSSTLEPITPTWSSNPLVSPIAALPVGDGLNALVLDAPANGRLREIELATGAIVREIATLGPGLPSAMALERGEQAVLVATDLSGVWRIERVELASGAITELIVSDGSQPGPVRGIASLGTNAAVFTAGSVLFSLDYRDPLVSQLGTLFSGLATPWGVVVDPLPPGRLYLAEREAVTATGTGRILAVELASHGRLPIVMRTEDLQPAHLERPSALALERHGSRMLIATNEPGGTSQLVGLDLGARGENVSFPIGPPRPSEIASIASGPDELRCAALPGEHELLIGGGLEQRRAIVAYDSARQEATLDTAFHLEARPGRPWRISVEPLLLASPAGREAAFVWSSGSDVPGGGTAFLRAIVRDDELGPSTEGRAPKQVRAALDVAPLVLGGSAITGNPSSVAAADLDGDGDRDLVSANWIGDNLTVFFQESPGRFSAAPLVLGGPGTTNTPLSVAVADLDGDGDQDLVSANEFGHNLAVFFQGSPGGFAAAPLVLGGFGITSEPLSVAAADLDGDGDQDLVSANRSGDNLTVFFQGSPGNFTVAPLVLGGPTITPGPTSVAAADLDGDGDQDLVCANSFGGDLTVFFQGPSGIFGATPLVLGGFGVTNSPVFVTAADLDGDGDRDLVCANIDDNGVHGDNLAVFFQESPGKFSVLPLVLGGPGITDSPRYVAAADLDGDGDQDLASAGVTVAVFFQDPLSSFSAAPLVLTNSALFVTADDLDGDGNQDLVSADQDGDNLAVFFQESPGNFAVAPLVLGHSGITRGPTSVDSADLDGDGDMDLVSANDTGDNLAVFFQESLGAFTVAPLVLGGPAITPGPNFVIAADLEGDGDQDLVCANFRGSNPTIFFQESPGKFTVAPLVLGGPTTTNGWLACVADLDDDGDQDLVCNNNNSLTVYFQESAGSFGTPLVLGGFPVTNGIVFVMAADLDEDGDQDLVSANLRGNNLTVFFQGSPGSFSASPLVLGGPGITSSPASVAAADLDGDGDQDLVSANLNSKNLTVFFQQSPGSFAAAPLTLGGPGTTNDPSSVAAADLDGDGDQDLVLVSQGNRNLAVFFQLSPGSFASAPLILGGPATGIRPSSLLVVDLEGDGDQDVVSANRTGDNLTIFWGGR